MNRTNRQRHNQRRLEMARQLSAAGVPLEIKDDAGVDPVFMSQIGSPLETCAFQLSYGGTAYLVNLSVTVNCSIFGIERFELDLPWKDFSIQWLPDPLETDSTVYRFPGRHPLEYDRSLVINHFAGLQREFRRGQFFQGFLMGIGSKSIPDDVRHGPVPGFVAIVDQHGQPHSTLIELFIDGTQRYSTMNRGESARRPLFDKCDTENGVGAKIRRER